MKKVAVLLSLAGIIFLAVMFVQEDKKQEESRKEYAAFQEELIPLNVEKRHIEKQLEDSREAEEETKEQKATASIMFTDLNKKIYDDALPLMNKYGYKGVLTISDTQFPGDKGCMTITHFKSLISKGWTYCLAWDGEKEFDAWYENIQGRMDKLKLKSTNAIYFEERNYKESYAKQLSKKGFQIVVHHGEEGLSVIPKEIDGDIWYPGIYGMLGEAPRTQLEEAIKRSSNIIYGVGFEEAHEKFDKETFEAMLEWFQSYEKEKQLSVTSLEDARQYQVRLADKAKKSQEKKEEATAELQDKLDAVNEEIEALHAKYNIK